MLWLLVLIALALLLALVLPYGHMAGESLGLWGGSLFIVMTAWGYLCTAQYLMGCGFSLAGCYGADIPEWINLCKLIFVGAYYVWCAAAVLKLTRRAFRLIKS